MGLFDKLKSAVTGEDVLARQGNNLLRRYKDGKQELEGKIIENERWFNLDNWNIIRNKAKDEKNNPEPVTAYLFNTICNKHADAMDNFPEPNVLAREESDSPEAEKLSVIIPCVLDKCKFRQAYSEAWWYKLKHGTGVYGVFWNNELENGLGDIDIKALDVLNIYWEPGVKHIQDSPNLFLVSLVDSESLKDKYPDLSNAVDGSKSVEVQQYDHNSSVDVTGKTVVVDWYYRKVINGKTVVHLTKFVDKVTIYSTEDDPDFAEKGLYDHGLYPIVMDPLFYLPDAPYGRGYIEILKSPQMYIDKLDQIIIKNSLMAGKKRFFAKRGTGINKDDFADWSKDIIEADSVDVDHVREFQVAPLHPFIAEHRSSKINELKEVSGVNEFNRGESGGGITAASAIMALQEAGNKNSRDMIAMSYEAYSDVIYMVIELIRQFYTEARSFRITQPNGQTTYTEYDNGGIQESEMPPAYEGQDLEEDYIPALRKPVFDIKVKPEKATPFSKIAHNELAKELFSAGFFNPEMSAQAKIALEMMSFEGKDKILRMIEEQEQKLLLQQGHP